MNIKFSKEAKKYFGAGVYEEGDRKRKKQPIQKYTNLADLPKLPFYEKIIDPTYLEIYRRDNNKDIVLPPKIKLDMENDPRLKYTPKKNRLPRIYPELDAYDRFVHIGQRKLFLSEIQHLSAKLKYKDEVAIVVYAGSAASNKGWMEHLMFPNVKFLFVDPNMFKIYISTYGTHTIYMLMNLELFIMVIQKPIIILIMKLQLSRLIILMVKKNLLCLTNMLIQRH